MIRFRACSRKLRNPRLTRRSSRIFPPAAPPAPPPGGPPGRWIWDRAELARLPGMTLLEFIELLPGVIRFRAGGFGRPEGIVALGAGGARVRVLLDGFELDPLGTGAFPLETIALLDLNRVIVERSLSGIRVELESFRLETSEPFSTVEMGTGAAQTRVLRALFSRGFTGGRSIGTGAFDLVTTGGIGVNEEYQHSNANLRWSHALGDDAGVQIEWRRTAVDRAGSVFPQQTTRSDLLVTTRTRIREALVLEAILGRSASEEEAAEAIPGRFSSSQAAARAAYSTERLGLSGLARVRSSGDGSVPLPAGELEGSVHFRPLPRLRIEADSRLARSGDESAAESRILASALLPGGISLFGSFAAGDRFVPSFEVDEAEAEEGVLRHLRGVPVRSTSGGWRFGAEIAGLFGSLGAAAFQKPESPVLPFGLPFDFGSPGFEAPALTGAEVYFRIPVPRTGGALRMEGWYSRAQDVAGRPYTPNEFGRVAVVFHDVFYDGQLEPSLRLEGIHRGSALVASEPGGEFSAGTRPNQTLDLSINIRILSVQAFLLWENVLNTQTATDFPDAPPAFPRIVYGASWQFLN
ncbi:MAG: TonB-dependent receptor plug domain-containing protein [Gemmatimonadota bacterium]